MGTVIVVKKKIKKKKQEESWRVIQPVRESVKCKQIKDGVTEAEQQQKMQFHTRSHSDRQRRHIYADKTYKTVDDEKVFLTYFPNLHDKGGGQGSV